MMLSGTRRVLLAQFVSTRSNAPPPEIHEAGGLMRTDMSASGHSIAMVCTTFSINSHPGVSQVMSLLLQSPFIKLSNLTGERVLSKL